jgi:hypothetical protein
MLRIILEFVRLSLCLVLFSSDGRDGPAQAVDGEASSPLMDDACIPIDIDMTLLVIKSIKTSSTMLSTMLNSSDIHTWG